MTTKWSSTWNSEAGKVQLHSAASGLRFISQARCRIGPNIYQSGYYHKCAENKQSLARPGSDVEFLKSRT